MLGVDPGTLVTGYAIVARNGASLSLITSGVISNPGTTPLPQRLQIIHQRLRDVIRNHHPHECAIESAFYGRNVQSALKLGHARGVALLAAVQEEIPTAEYAPREIKKAVVGRGGASKQQVRSMVMTLLHLPAGHIRLDASDAIAVALCHLHRPGVHRSSRGDWAAFVAAHPGRVHR